LALVDFNELDGIFFNGEIDRYYGGCRASYEFSLICQPNVVSAWRRQGGGVENLTRHALAFRAHTNHGNNRYLEPVLLRHVLVRPVSVRTQLKPIIGFLSPHDKVAETCLFLGLERIPVDFTHSLRA